MTSQRLARDLGGEVRIYANATEVAHAAAAWIAQSAGAAATQRGRFNIALSGGETPRPAYEALAGARMREAIDWAAWHLYFVDERAVPPGDPQSNYRLVREALLDHVPVPGRFTHRMEAERSDLDAAAAEYSALLERTLPHLADNAPRLDAVLLGLGENGHTASLFPGTAALGVTDRWATRGRADYPPFDRITLTFPAINAAATIAFLVVGATKRAALRGVIDGTVPASRVHPVDGTLLWFLDRDAAQDV